MTSAILFDLDDTLVVEEPAADAAFLATAELRRLHEAFADARPALGELRMTHKLALVTNGASCLQREKLAGAGISEEDFDAVVISGDIGIAKPRPEVFAHTLDELGVGAAE